MNKIGEKLQNARKIAGLTQDQVSKLLKISRGKIIAIEKGEADIEFSLLGKLAHLYGFSLQYFSDDEGLNAEEGTFNFALRAEDLNTEDEYVKTWGRRVLINIRDLKEIAEEAGL